MTLPSMEQSPILVQAEAIRQAMLRRDVQQLNRLAAEYAKALRRLKDDIKRAEKAIAEIQPTRGQLMNLGAMRSLMSGIREELEKLAGILGADIEKATLAEMELAAMDARLLVQSRLPFDARGRILAEWTRLTPQQVYRMFGFTDPQGVLYAKIAQQYSEDVAGMIGEKLLQGYVMGWNPRKIAYWISNSLTSGIGQGLNWAMTTARTASLWSYRAATHANYLANSNVVQGWIWYAFLGDGRACMSCVAKHGSVHAVTEVLADHHRGRCTAIPITASYAQLGIEGIDEPRLEIQSGEAWFKKQPREAQIQMMGAGKWQAWKDRKFEFENLSMPYQDQVYGQMYREATLAELVGVNG